MDPFEPFRGIAVLLLAERITYSSLSRSKKETGREWRSCDNGYVVMGFYFKRKRDVIYSTARPQKGYSFTCDLWFPFHHA